MPHAQVNGVSVYYEDHGSGLPLLLTHGYSSTGDMWRPQVEALSGRYRVIIWDMRGHGRTDSPGAPEAYSEALTVADMCELLRSLRVRRAVVGGHSLGGYMSLAFHMAHPEMVRALVLCDTGPGYRSDRARAGWNEMAEAQAGALEEKGLEALGRSLEVTTVRHQQRSALGLALAARGVLAQHDSRVIDSLASIAVPTLVVVGERDKLFLAASDYMVSHIPGTRKVVVSDAGHAPNLEQPHAFNGALQTFLDSLGLEGDSEAP